MGNVKNMEREKKKSKKSISQFNHFYRSSKLERSETLELRDVNSKFFEKFEFSDILADTCNSHNSDLF